MQNTELRPLGAGELLDRAVTLFVRRFVPIVVVLAMAIVPLMLLQALIAPNSAHVFNDLGTIFSQASNPKTAGDLQATMAKYNTGVAGTLGYALIAVVVRLLMWSAIVVVVASAYTAGTTTTPRDAYIVGVNCWPAQVLVGIAFGVAGGICAVPLMIVYIAGIFAVVLLASVSPVLAAIVGIIGAIALIGAASIGGAFLYMTYELAAIFVVTESPNAIVAIQTAIRRVAARATFWRTVVAGLVVFAMTQGGSIPFAFAAGLLTALTHVDAFYYAILGTGTILLDGLVAAFAVVYATDVRIRREGLDLIALTAPAQTQPVAG